MWQPKGTRSVPFIIGYLLFEDRIMQLTETEKQSLAWCMEELDTGDYDEVNPVSFDVPNRTIEIPIKTLKKGLDGLIRKNILMFYNIHDSGVLIKFNAIKALLAYNGIFSDTLTDPKGVNYPLLVNFDD